MTSQYYVDYGAGSDTTGDGTIGTPWQTLQHALNTITRDATNGDQINVKAGTAQVLAAVLSFASYGSSATVAAPLILRGYTSALNDGGMATIDANGNAIVNNTSFNYLFCRDLHFTNSGSSHMIRAGQYNTLIRCWFTNGTGRAIWPNVANSPFVVGCYIAVQNSTAVTMGNRSLARFNYIVGGTILLASSPSGVVDSNIIVPPTNGNGIAGDTTFPQITNNIIVAPNASTGAGILISTGGNSQNGVIINNIVAGFSGTGGAGLRIQSGAMVLQSAANAWYNNTTNVDVAGRLLHDDGGHVVLAADPFTDAANGDFSLTTAALAVLRSAGWPALYEGAHANTVPNITIGALQYGPTPPPSGGGGGGPVIGSRVIRGLGAI
jgi:hypothetical protein